MKILAIESSFDETAAAIVEDGTIILSTSIASSTEFHRKYGGTLPELAARKQLGYILPIITEAVLQAFPSYNKETISHAIQKEIDAIAVTVGPGLIGSLLVGIEAAKTIAFVTKKPIIPINHVHAHIYANFVGKTIEKIHFPAVALVVSGGHTELFQMDNEHKLIWLGGTIDDAAGEAFDKTARLLGFENRGGAAIEKAAKDFDIHHSIFDIRLPRPLMHDDTLNFSFSGLKTAIQREWKKYVDHSSELVSVFAYEVQEAITDVLVKKTLKAADQIQARSIFIAGGVAANQRLRDKFTTKLIVHAPPIELCTDNAVTIGSCAFYLGKQYPWQKIEAQPNLSVEIVV